MIDLYILTQPVEHPSTVMHQHLAEILRQEYGISRMELQYGPYGKPFLKNGPHFSISHSRGYGAVAFSSEPVGLDMELVRAYHQGLPQRIFSKGEMNWFRERSCLRRDFFALWTLKESYYKYLGTGLPGFPNDTDFYYDGAWHLRNQSLWFHMLEEKTLLLTLCGEKQSDVTIHRL